jgi:hypothetical protein
VITEEYYLKHTFSKGRVNAMRQRGADWTALMRKGAFLNLDSAITRIDAENEKRGRYRSVPKNKQLDTLDSLHEHPLRGSYVLAIGSVSTDLAAKQLALELFDRAFTQQVDNPRFASRDFPIWHTIYGGLPDRMRDDYNGTPSMLVLSGLAENSMPLKLEKLRDLLDKYRDIPRIVLVGGQDPVSFFAERVHYPLKAALYIVDDHRYRRKGR